MSADILGPFFRTYLFFLVVSLFATGCLDIDLGDNGNGENAKDDEMIIGSVEEVPDNVGGVSGLLARVTSGDGTRSYEDTTAESSGDFSISGNFDGSNTKFEIFENDNSDSALGTIRLNVFPGAALDIGDIRVGGTNIELTEDINITFTGEVSEKTCESRGGNLDVVIESDGKRTEVTVSVTASTEIEIGSDEDLECGDIVTGSEAEIDGKLLLGSTVEATIIDIDE